MRMNPQHDRMHASLAQVGGSGSGLPAACRTAGSVMLEFVISFPIVMITFFFAWQVIHIYIYDILGTYATFAAARSYSVFRYHPSSDSGGDKPEVMRTRAALLARDVAVAIMAPYTGGAYAKEEDASFTLSEGVDQAAEYLHPFLPKQSKAYRIARDRMQPFRITEYGPDGSKSWIISGSDITEDSSAGGEPGGADALILPLREGYGYRDGYRIKNEKGLFGSGLWGSPWQADKPVSQKEEDKGLLETFSQGAHTVYTFFMPENTAVGMQVARVSFSYRYSLFTAYLRKSFFPSQQENSDIKDITALSIYNACAMPIEPEMLVTQQVTKAEIVEPPQIDQEKIASADNQVKWELDNYEKACDAVISDLNAQPNRLTWPSGLNWNHGKGHSKPGLREKEMTVFTHGSNLPNVEGSGNAANLMDKTLVPNVAEYILKEKDYRQTIIAEIEKEIADYQSQIKEKLKEIAEEKEKEEPDTHLISDLESKVTTLNEEKTVWDTRKTNEETLRDSKTNRDNLDKAAEAVKVALKAWYEASAESEASALGQWNAMEKEAGWK